MKARLSAARITPKKANLIAGMVRGKNVKEAVTILKYTPKKAAKILHKLLESAIANAINNFDQDESSLFIEQIIVNKGATLKRSVPISRGRMHPILKRTSHITIQIGINPSLVNKKADVSVKEETAEASKPAAKKTTKKSSTSSKVKVTSKSNK